MITVKASRTLQAIMAEKQTSTTTHPHIYTETEKEKQRDILVFKFYTFSKASDPILYD